MNEMDKIDETDERIEFLKKFFKDTLGSNGRTIITTVAAFKGLGEF